MYIYSIHKVPIKKISIHEVVLSHQYNFYL